jgi:hypothetical protein
MKKVNFLFILFLNFTFFLTSSGMAQQITPQLETDYPSTSITAPNSCDPYEEISCIYGTPQKRTVGECYGRLNPKTGKLEHYLPKSYQCKCEADRDKSSSCPFGERIENCAEKRICGLSNPMPISPPYKPYVGDKGYETCMENLKNRCKSYYCNDCPKPETEKTCCYPAYVCVTEESGVKICCRQVAGVEECCTPNSRDPKIPACAADV